MTSVRMHAPPRAARLHPGGLGDLAAAVDRRRDEALRAAGAEAAARELRDGACAALDAAAERLEADRARLAEELAPTAVELALAIARELLRAEVDAGRYDLEAIVRDTLRAADHGHGTCAVHLNPEDAAALAGARFRAGVHVEPDTGVGRGCVHVATPQGLLVRDLRGALDGVAAKLREGAA